MLLIHGLTDSGDGWADAVRHWGDTYSIVTVDQRGHGGSPRFTAEQVDNHPGEVMVADALALLEQLDRPVVVGHSLGGAVALDAAVRRPDLVRALVLEDPAPRGPEEPQVGQRGPTFLEELRPSREAADDEELLRLRREQHPDWPESELLATGHAEQQVDAVFLERGDWKPVTPWPVLFGRLSVPTLVVSGERRDEICVDDDMEKGLAGLANRQVTLVRLPGAGHCVRREQPERFYRVVDEWLGSVT
jgi:pimeloyl-ACP methyl ester carboxylesterase